MNTRLILVFLIFLGLGSSGLIAQESDYLTPLDIAKLQSVSTPIISDDGSLIAYRLVKQADPLQENKTPSYELRLYDLNTKEDIPFVTRQMVSAIAFRPKHNSITFLSKTKDDNYTSLYEISVNGGEALKIFEFDRSIVFYQWASDGQSIAFTSKEDIKGNESDLPYQPEIYEEYTPKSLGYIVDISNKDIKQIPLEGSIYNIQWSPDASKMCIAAAPTALVDDFYMRQQMHILSASDFKVMGKIEHDGKLGQIGWSPDGKNIAFIGAANINDPIAGRLFVVDAQGGAPNNLTADYLGMIDHFEWSGANKIDYLASKNVYSEFGFLNAKTGKMTVLLPNETYTFNSFGRSEYGQRIFSGSSPKYPTELFLQVASNKPNRITNSNPWLDAKKLASQEVVNFKARDGVEIEGILFRPINEQSGVKYPLITVVHGGPESHYDNAWITGYSTPGHVAAAKGYAVFYPNYRGSTGRGLEFAMSSQADLAGKEFDDVVDGVDYLIESGLVDKDRVGVTGGSYGGYATAWMSTRYSDRFAAGVMFVGISDNLSKWGTSDIPEELYEVHARKRVWDDYEWFLKRSPVYYVDQAKTPLLIMHGKNDTRVHPSQSMELYRHIKTRTDTPVRLVFYPGEGHGNRNSTARLDYNLRSLRWFDHYLKDDKSDLNAQIDLEGVNEK